MSVDAAKTSGTPTKGLGGKVEQKPDEITLTIDGIEVSVPKGTLVIRAAERLGIAIPRFCDHPLLDPVGACRQCMVEVPDMGNGRGMPKPQASCTLEVAPGMKVLTQLGSDKAAKAQGGMLELLLINHPLDCPICDKGGECPLQNQAMSGGRGDSRFEGIKRTFPKPINVSAEVLLDRERCVLCARCTRFSEQISGDPFIALVERGALQQVGIYEEHPYDSYFSGNVIQICPVGALTSASYRFQSRPFDLVSTVTSCEHCASGCQLRTDHRHYQVKRRLAGNDHDVNEEWNCDKGRFAFMYGRGDDRLTHPLVRRDGKLVPVGWHEAIDAAVAGLQAAGSSVGVLPGGRLTLEASYAYAKFARAVLGTNSIDCRSRPGTDEEAGFLSSVVAGRSLGESVTYGDLERASQVVLVGFEPEDESPIVFLRLRKANRKNKLQVVTVAPFRSRGSQKMGARLVPAVPGTEATVLERARRAGPHNDGNGENGIDFDAGTIVLVGERAALSQGTLTTVASICSATGARFAWVPRRAGEVGAIEAGCLPGLLPGGRRAEDAQARVDLQAAWGVQHLPTEAGLTADGIIGAVASGEVQALVAAGIEPRDFRDPDAVTAAIEDAGFVVSLEQRFSAVAQRADVVLPVALLEDTSGTFLNWEHRPRPVARVNSQSSSPMTDIRVLAALADALGTPLGFRTPAKARAEFDELGGWEGGRASLPAADTRPYLSLSEGGLQLATWRVLLDDSAAVDHEPDLMATAPQATARLSPATAARLGLTDGDEVAVHGLAGSLVLPLTITADMVDDVVWVPSNSGSSVTQVLGVLAGDRVDVRAVGVDAAAALEGGAA